jgi:hypothetical protein
VEQANRFTQDTSIPILTVTVPHIYRCQECEGWITFCDSVIERTAAGESSAESMSALDCPHFGDDPPCEHTVYYGRIEVGGERRRYHYSHLLNNRYVQERVLRTEEDRRNKLVHYFPFVKGLERLKEV